MNIDFALKTVLIFRVAPVVPTANVSRWQRQLNPCLLPAGEARRFVKLEWAVVISPRRMPVVPGPKSGQGLSARKCGIAETAFQTLGAVGRLFLAKQVIVMLTMAVLGSVALFLLCARAAMHESDDEHQTTHDRIH